MIKKFRQWVAIDKHHTNLLKEVRELEQQREAVTKELKVIEGELISAFITEKSTEAHKFIRVDGKEYNVTRYGIYPIQFDSLNDSSDDSPKET